MKDVLKQLQNVQIEILNIIDNICRENGLRYSLYAGTLLGAVRHNGFIPWDDDLDVCMPREDYNKFIFLWDKLNIQGYILQNKDNTSKFTQSFSKIRKNNTCFLQTKEESGKYHTGIFVDIFPVDRIPTGKIKRLLYIWSCMKYQLYTREFIPSEEKLIIKVVAMLLLKIVPDKKREKARKDFEKKLLIYDKDKSSDIIFIETMGTMKKIMPYTLLDDYVYLQFGEKKYMCFKMWNEYLTKKYGDYMNLPPENERKWKHHPIILNFESSYEELEDKEKSVN